MTKETIYNKIRETIRPKFEGENQKFVSLAISPYHPILVVEFIKRRSSKNPKTKNKWVTILDHYQIANFKGVEKLYQQYLKAS